MTPSNVCNPRKIACGGNAMIVADDRCLVTRFPERDRPLDTVEKQLHLSPQ